MTRVDRLQSETSKPGQEKDVEKMVLTSHDVLGNTGLKTGFGLEEFAAPYFVFRDAGVQLTLGSARGGQPPLDPKSDLPASPTPAQPKRYRKDVPNVEVHIVDGGHFALDTAADEIAALVQGCVGSSREVVRDAAAKMKPL